MRQALKIIGTEIQAMSLAAIAFLGPVLKGFGLLDAPWWWLLSPIWATVGLAMVVGVLYGLVRAAGIESDDSL